MKLLKKAQIGGIQQFVLSIITVAIVLAIGLIVLNEMGDTAKELATTSVSNESVAATGSSLSQSSLLVGASACRNASMDTIPIGTYCNVSSGGVVAFDATNFSSGGAYIDYSHYTPSAAYNSTGTILTKLATVPTWIGIIIIVALAFIVLSFFIGKRQ